MALAQAQEVRDRMQAVWGGAATSELCIIKTSGDRILDKSLAAVGGKGLFTKELEDALLAGVIDIAVHSMKDMPAVLPPGLEIVCVLPRADVRDALISPVAASWRELPFGAVVGTASIRREAYLRHRRPDLKTVLFRGNVATRLNRLAQGEAQATLLAVAGLQRLGMADRIAQVIPVEDILPAPAQGAIGIEMCMANAGLREMMAGLHDAPTGYAIAAERAFLAELDGSCRTPLAALGRVEGTELFFKGAILTPDGTRCYETERRGGVGDAVALGQDAARELYACGGKAILEAAKSLA